MDKPEGELSALRLMVVDDHEINREFLATALGPQVADLRLASSGPQAIAMAGRQHFDVILMDLHMPGMDGLTALQTIRLQAKGRPLPKAIALTADTRPEERERLLSSGFDDFLNKPVSIGRLLDAIRALYEPGVSESLAFHGVSEGGDLLEVRNALAAANGDQALLARLQTTFAEQLPGEFEKLERLIDQQQFEQAAGLLHRWQGACGYTGTIRLKRYCERAHGRLLASVRPTGAELVELTRLVHATHAALKLAHRDFSS